MFVSRLEIQECVTGWPSLVKGDKSKNQSTLAPGCLCCLIAGLVAGVYAPGSSYSQLLSPRLFGRLVPLATLTARTASRPGRPSQPGKVKPSFLAGLDAMARQAALAGRAWLGQPGQLTSNQHPGNHPRSHP